MTGGGGAVKKKKRTAANDSTGRPLTPAQTATAAPLPLWGACLPLLSAAWPHRGVAVQGAPTPLQGKAHSPHPDTGVWRTDPARHRRASPCAPARGEGVRPPDWLGRTSERGAPTLANRDEATASRLVPHPCHHIRPSGGVPSPLPSPLACVRRGGPRCLPRGRSVVTPGGTGPTGRPRGVGPPAEARRPVRPMGGCRVTHVVGGMPEVGPVAPRRSPAPPIRRPKRRQPPACLRCSGRRTPAWARGGTSRAAVILIITGMPSLQPLGGQPRLPSALPIRQSQGGGANRAPPQSSRGEFW